MKIKLENIKIDCNFEQLKVISNEIKNYFSTIEYDNFTLEPEEIDVSNIEDYDNTFFSSEEFAEELEKQKNEKFITYTYVSPEFPEGRSEVEYIFEILE